LPTTTAVSNGFSSYLLDSCSIKATTSVFIPEFNGEKQRRLTPPPGISNSRYDQTITRGPAVQSL
jgi:hypothetical protein